MCNVKPIMGELEFKLEKRAKPLLYVKVQVGDQLRGQQDLRLSFESTQIIFHRAFFGQSLAVDLKATNIDLDEIVSKLVDDSNETTPTAC
jgi:hypothetical protein